MTLSFRLKARVTKYSLWTEVIKKEVCMSKTEDNLKEAFAGESQANRKYLAFAAKAEQEGYKTAAKLVSCRR